MKILLIGLLSTLMIGSVFAQSDDYYQETEIYYSDKLVVGVELTWEFTKFSFEIHSDSDNVQLNQATTTPTATESISTTTDETTVYTETVTVTETSNDDEIPDIKPGTTVTVKILKDLNDFSQDWFWGSDDEESIVDEYFEMTISDPSLDEDEMFPPFFLISPSIIEFENGTRVNFFEYQYEILQANMEAFTDEDYDDYPEIEFKLENGVFTQKSSYTYEDDDGTTESNTIEIRTDIETGVIIYMYTHQSSSEMDGEFELKLKQSSGGDIGNIVANDDPTLSIPFSVTFVYSLILLPIIVSRIRKNNS